jgi:hypothetical protein
MDWWRYATLFPFIFLSYGTQQNMTGSHNPVYGKAWAGWDVYEWNQWFSRVHITIIQTVHILQLDIVIPSYQ